MIERLNTPSRVAVIQTAFLGDVVFTSPLVGQIKHAWPDAHLTMVVRPKALEIAQCIPGVDAAIGYDKRGQDRGWAALKRTAAAMGSPQVVFVPHPSFRSALLAWYSGASVRVGQSVGIVHQWMYTLPVKIRREAPFVERFLDLGRVLGWETSPSMRLETLPDQESRAQVILKGRPSVGLIIGSEWATKRWPVEKFAILADELVLAGVQPVLLGAPSERLLAQEVKKAMQSQPLDLVGNSISESIGVIAQLEGVVGGDTGFSHVGRALGIPALVLFGPTDPAAHVWEPHARALSLGMECQPCHAHGPTRCPRAHHSCMREMRVSIVLAALWGLIKRGRRKP